MHLEVEPNWNEHTKQPTTDRSLAGKVGGLSNAVKNLKNKNISSNQQLLEVEHQLMEAEKLIADLTQMITYTVIESEPHSHTQSLVSTEKLRELYEQVTVKGYYK